GPCEPGRNTYLIFLENLIGINVRNAEELVEIVDSDTNERVAAFGNPARDFSADSRYLTFELPQAGFVSVLQDDSFERRAADSQVANRDAVGLHLFRNNMPPGDLDLLLFGVAGQAYDLHPVSQSRVHGVEHVCSSHKHHIR